MNISRAMIIAAVLACCVPRSTARPIITLQYQELLNKSDMVVIATPLTKTVDTDEHLPGIVSQDQYGTHSPVYSVGVETTFAVSAVLKGDTTVEAFVLHHYRTASKEPAVNGPLLVFFDSLRQSSYLLFLTRESDGRYAPTGGQTDPAFKAIQKIELELTKKQLVGGNPGQRR